MKRLLALLLALLMLCSAAAACAEPVLPAAETEEIEEIEIVPFEEAIGEEDIEIELDAPEEVPVEALDGEALEEAEPLPEELPEVELDEVPVIEDGEDVPEDGNEAAGIITNHPRSIIVSDGGTATFTVVSNYASPTYQWQWRPDSSTEWTNTQLAGCHTATLSFTATLGMNGRQYRCVVQEGANPRASIPATLTVTNKATITGHPSDGYAPVGYPVKFTVTAAGKGLHYQWQWRANSSDAWTNTQLNGYNTPELNFTVSAGMGGRQYRCHVTDSSGGEADSNPATLYIGGAVITTQPANVSVAEGAVATFTVKAAGSGLTYQWQWRANASSAWASTSLNGHNTSKLSFTVTAGMNGRQYRCIVQDRIATSPRAVSNPATLTVKVEAAKIITQPKDLSVSDEGEAKFTVGATGSSLKYQWQWRANASGTWADTSLNGCKTDTLDFTVSMGMNGRQYRCGVTASVGETAWSSPATLTVTAGKLEIVQGPSDCAVEPGEKALFDVVAKGNGLKYQWQWRAGVYESWANTSLEGYNTAMLEFTASKGMHGRQYRCYVKDKYGHEAWSKEATLWVGDGVMIYDQPRNCVAPAGSEAWFSVGAAGNGLKYQWKWRPNASAAWQNTTLQGYDTDWLEFTVSEGMNGRQYCCFITDAYGNEIWSDPATLAVHETITIWQSVYDVKVNAGQKAVFVIGASGKNLKYQWQWRAGETGEWQDTKLEGYNTDTLSFTASSGMNGRHYRCCLTDYYGDTDESVPATLTVVSATITPTELSTLLDMSTSQRNKKLMDMGFTFDTWTDEETGEISTYAILDTAYGYILVEWDNDENKWVSIYMDGFHSSMYAMAGVTPLMSVAQARSALSGAGWSFDFKDVDEDDGMIYYWYNKSAGSQVYSISVETYDDNVIFALYEQKDSL